MNRHFTDSPVSKDTRCMICGKVHNTGVITNSLMSTKPNLPNDDCYLIYKRLLGIFGTSYISVLNSY